MKQMKQRGISLLALAMSLCLLAGCGVADTRGSEDSLLLFYAASLETHRGGDAIDSVAVSWNLLPQEDKQAQAEAVLALLLGECSEEGFQSPIPNGTVLRSVELKGSTVCVDFSGSYGQLSGMALTIADYCVTLSLTQLSGVHAVRITVNGQELDYRDSNLFLASDVLLTSTDDVARMLAARLYFPDGDGVLTAEERLLTQYEGQSAVDLVLSALAEGPTEEGLAALLPDGITDITARVEENVCQLNLPSESWNTLEEDTAALVLQGIVQSLQSLEGVSTVQVYLDGEYMDVYAP